MSCWSIYGSGISDIKLFEQSYTYKNCYFVINIWWRYNWYELHVNFTTIPVYLNFEILRLLSPFIHGFLDTILHIIRTILRTVFNVIFMILNSLNISNLLSWFFNSIQLSHLKHIVIMTNMFPITTTLKWFYQYSSITISYPNLGLN